MMWFAMGILRRSPEGMRPAPQQALVDTAPPPDLQDVEVASLSGARLIILWSAREPDRVGESALVYPSGSHILGRAPQLQDGEQTLRFLQDRPHVIAREGLSQDRQASDLQGEALSRRQLAFGWEGTDLFVRNIGRCPLWINGFLQGRARLQIGDRLHLQNQLVLLVARSPSLRSPGPAVQRETPFGVADADGLVGESAALWHLRQQIAQHGPSDDHILVIGPSGAGKELVAQALVRHSARAARPLISENVSTLPSSLAATLLFGNRRNFPNPGMEERPGLIGLAENGTLFLDEIGDMSSDVQPLLLRVMERTGEYLRIGDEARPRRANIRVIAATNHPERLRPELRRRFPREIHLPGLGARPEDIPLLARHLFLKQLAQRPELQRFVAHAQPQLDPRLIEQLVSHVYSTHVAELAFLLEQSLGSSPEDTLLPLSLAALRLRASPPASVPDPPLPADAPTPSLDKPTSLPRSGELPSALQAQRALDTSAGSVVQAAKQLGINRHQLNRLIRRHALVVSRGPKKESVSDS